MGMEMNNIDIEKEKRPYPPRCTELLERFKSKEALPMGEKLQFSGVDGQDVYNITAPFLLTIEQLLLGAWKNEKNWQIRRLCSLKRRMASGLQLMVHLLLSWKMVF